MNMASKFMNWRSNKRAVNKLRNLSGYQLNDMGIKRFITATDTVRFY